MKRCPTCDKEFPDSMRFCQTDGTVLIEDAPAADPYKTVVGNQSDIASAIPPLDPFKTMVASPPPKKADDDDDLLQLPDEPDQMKTMVVTPEEMKEELRASGNEDMLSLDSSPTYAPSAPLIEPKPPASGFSAPPKSPEPSATDATMIMNSGSLPENSPSPFDSKPFENDFSTQSPYGNQDNKPIPSPFQDSLPPNFQPPSASPFDAPSTPVKESESAFGSAGAGNSPFQPPTPFGQPESGNSPVQQAGGWNPPSLPDSEWQNQQAGANVPARPAAGNKQDQTLAIVSLVLGILSFLCGSLLMSVPAIIIGYMQKNKIKSDPAAYGGGTLATIGMILGVINVILTVIVLVIYIILIVSAASR